MDTLSHLQAHHRDFGEFRDIMEQTSAGRFGAMYWSVLEQQVLQSRSGVLVDFGTGPGNFLEFAHARYPELELIGVEYQPEMLLNARQRVARLGDRVHLVEGDLAKPPLEYLDTHSADAATASMLLHEMPIPTHLLREAGRVLKPNARMLILDWVKHPLREYTDEIDVEASDEELLDRFNHFSEHCRYTPDDIAFLGEQCGFAAIDSITLRGGKFAMVILENLG